MTAFPSELVREVNPMSNVRWVRTYCDRDGEVVVLRQEVLLAIFPAGATYTFRCPRCAQRVVREASPNTVVVLVDAEVPTRRIALPEQPDPADPPITADDVISFFEALESSTDPLEELLR